MTAIAFPVIPRRMTMFHLWNVDLIRKQHSLMKMPTLIAATALLAVGAHADMEPIPPPTPKITVILPAGRDVNSPGGLPLRMLFDFPVRDPNMCAGPDGNYYLVGTTESADGHGSMWEENDGVRMWRSRDRIHWEKMGFVWTFDRDGTWSKEHKKSPFVSPNGELRRALWAPEIHYFKGTYWIPYSMNYTGTGILKSTTGKPEGPYVDVKKDGPLTDMIDPSVFMDDDGKVYMLWADYNIALMKDDMSGLAEAPRRVQLPSYPWGEGIFMVKVGKKYIFLNSGTADTTFGGKPVKTYDCYSAVSTDSIYGPYTAIYRAIPHAGHNNLFQDKKGDWWSTYFGSGDPHAPWEIKPGLLPVTITPDGHVSAKFVNTGAEWRYTTTAPADDWTHADFKDKAWTKGAAGFGDPAILASGPVSIVGTPWKTGDVWMRRTFEVKDTVPNPQLYVRHCGDAEVFLNGKIVAGLKGNAENYETLPLSDPAALKAGVNTIAVHAVAPADHAAYIDVGIVSKP